MSNSYKNFPPAYVTGIMRCVCMHITSKQVELESLGWPGFSSKPDQPGLSSSICLEVVMEQSWYIKLSVCFSSDL